MVSEKVDEKKANRALYLTAIVIGLMVLFLITNGAGLFNKNPSTGRIVLNEIPLEIKNAPVLGQKNASLTIYLFSDFSCSFCAAASGKNIEMVNYMTARDPLWSAPMPGIIKDYVLNGKAKIVWKYFPGHGAAMPAQRVAWCLNEQNLFWEFHDKAFENQKEVSSLSKMREIAEEIGGNLTLLDSCLNSKKYESLFKEDAEMGKANGVSGTPTFFIEDKIITGAQSYEAIKSIIESYL